LPRLMKKKSVYNFIEGNARLEFAWEKGGVAMGVSWGKSLTKLSKLFEGLKEKLGSLPLEVTKGKILGGGF